MAENIGRDNDKQEEQQKWKPSTIRVVMGIMMKSIYLGMSYMLLLTRMFDLNDTVRYVMGGVFALYGIFRGYRLFVGMNLNRKI